MEIVRTADFQSVVTLDAAKTFLRVDGDDEDSLIGGLLASATNLVEKVCNRILIEESVTLLTTGFPCGPVLLFGGKVSEVSAVRYLNSQNIITTLSPSSYRVDVRGVRGLVDQVVSWPSTSDAFNSVQVEYTVGYESADKVPEPIKTAILLLAASWYANREAVVTGTIVEELPLGVRALLTPYRLIGF